MSEFQRRIDDTKKRDERRSRMCVESGEVIPESSCLGNDGLEPTHAICPKCGKKLKLRVAKGGYDGYMGYFYLPRHNGKNHKS